MKTVIVDASVLLCILLREEQWKKTAKAIEGFLLVGTASLPLEIGNSLSALVRRGLLDPETGIAVWEAYLEIPVRLLDIPMKNALRIAFAKKLYAYDAYVLALGEAENIDIATLDRGMAKTAEELGISVLEV
jgi:predicted nucleic acid-binding protein